MKSLNKKYKVFTLKNFRDIPQVDATLSESDKKVIEVVGNVLPFKVNNYVTEELIDWSNVPNDPIFQLTFPQKGMLCDDDFQKMESVLSSNPTKAELKSVANTIRYDLNPHPAGQMESNVPIIDGIRLPGIQHKYEQTALFFPSHSQTCHAYCTFCFRWPQFVGIDELKFAMKETELLIKYVRRNKKITDVLFTGGDPMVMTAKRFEEYINPLMNANIENLQNIRIGTKSLSYWPYRFISDNDANDMLRLFEKIIKRGYHLTIMAHFNHSKEMMTPAVEKAISRILSTGAQIRTQSPIMKNINDNPDVWRDMWTQQVKLGCIPYYMFIARDTGAQDYFAVPLEKCWKIFREAYQQVSGLARTVRGPSMSASPGKVQILGVNEIAGEKVFSLRFLQGRNSNWIGQTFFAKYDPNAIWLDDLKPAFGERSFFFNKKLPELNLN